MSSSLSCALVVSHLDCWTLADIFYVVAIVDWYLFFWVDPKVRWSRCEIMNRRHNIFTGHNCRGNEQDRVFVLHGHVFWDRHDVAVPSTAATSESWLMFFQCLNVHICQLYESLATSSGHILLWTSDVLFDINTDKIVFQQWCVGTRGSLRSWRSSSSRTPRDFLSTWWPTYSKSRDK